jgi:hypothetical protein
MLHQEAAAAGFAAAPLELPAGAADPRKHLIYIDFALAAQKEDQSGP